MTDHPRFEPVKGEPDVVHEAYHGGSLVSLVLRLVDRWRSRPRKDQEAPALGQACGAVEIHERPPALAHAAPLHGAAEAMAPEQGMHRLAPDEGFSGSFLIGSARTMKLQAGLLAAFVAVVIVLVTQGVSPPERPHDQTARGLASSSGQKALGEDSMSFLLVAQERPGQVLP